MKLRNKAVRKNIQHYRYYEATNCFLMLEFISAAILYITVHKIKVGRQQASGFCAGSTILICVYKENRI